ncbi:hypothetical protein [Agrobacterium pusense]|uniref:hypothetical protein n=1 Tax=Agrobacterium pusense TaxID=648995 RepID=UPI001F3534FF|nr:hypothetical protein [Agrobacterium pusense]
MIRKTAMCRFVERNPILSCRVDTGALLRQNRDYYWSDSKKAGHNAVRPAFNSVIVRLPANIHVVPVFVRGADADIAKGTEGKTALIDQSLAAWRLELMLPSSE